MKIRKGDNVRVVTGNDRGKTGKVLSVLREAGKVVMEGANMRKKHMRPRRQGQKGEVVSIPAPIAASRVMVVCGSCGKASRIGFSLDEKGIKTRVCKKCGSVQ